MATSVNTTPSSVAESPDLSAGHCAWPLLPLQRSMAMALQLSGPEGIDLEQLVWRMDPPISPAALEGAFSAATQRHEGLRISFSLHEGPGPLQLLRGEVAVGLREIAVPTEEAWREQAIARFLEEDRGNPIDLAEAPPWRLSLLQFAPDSAALVWTFPHALLDGRSLGLILAEIAAEVSGDPDANAGPPDLSATDLADYLAWRSGLDHGAALRWWAERLGNISGPVEFPRDPAAGGAGMVTEELALDEAAMAPIRETAARLEMTINAFCQAAWALALASQSGRSDVVFAAVRACRHGGGDHSRLAGMLMNSVPVRAAAAPEKTAAGLLGELSRWQIEARTGEFAPLEEIQRAAGVPPGSLLCGSVLMVDHERPWARAAAILGPGHAFSLIERPSAPVTVSIAAGKTLDAVLMARASLMGQDAAGRLLRQFGHVLREIAREPEIRLGKLDLITPEDRFRTVTVYNATTAPYPDTACLHSAFEAQADMSAGRTAVFASDGILTYGKLELQANRLANHLISRGVLPGGLVVIRLEKTMQLPVAILAVLKAGCGYVPVDPSWPQERFRHVAETTRAAAVISLADGWPEDFRHPQVVLLDRDQAAIGVCSSKRPGVFSDPSQIAYIIFTSGSTGTPKGVTIDHRGAVNTVSDCNSRFALGASDRIFGISAPTFDLSVYDVFGPLSVGGAVVLCSAKDARSPEVWGQLVAQHGVTVWNSVPQIVEMLIEGVRDNREILASLRLVMMSGDCIPTGLPDRIRAQIPRAAIWSLGGATEASIWSIARPIHDVDPAWTSIPYGRPMANQSFFVLDEQMRPCPILVAGDLYIGGIGLAQGYWGDPERTGKSFPTHPRWGMRLYRTGDRGRFLATNEIEFLGRRDDQVKLRGFRIELGEIEHAMARLPWVRECVAAKTTLASGAESLVGYIVPSIEAAFDAEALREHMHAALPSYMVPALFVCLPRLPLSANGKVDRKALPAPELSLPAASAEWSESEMQMAAMWEEVLSVKPDSPDRSFFDYGGNSLLSFRLVELIKRRTGRQLRVNAMFESRPTVTSMAREWDAAAPAAAGPASEESDRPRWLMPVRTYGSRPPFIFLGQYLDLGRYLSPDQPFYGVLIGSEIRLELPDQNFAETAATVLREIKRIQPRGPYHFGGYCFGAVLAFEIALQLREQGEQIAYFCMVEPSAPAGIAPLPMARFAGLRYGLAQLRKGFSSNPFAVVAKGVGRLLDNIRLRCLGLSNERLFEDFVPRVYDGPVDMFLCHDSPYRIVPECDPRLGWGKWCKGLAVDQVSGNHLTMLREPLVRSFALLVESRLGGARSTAAGGRPPARASALEASERPPAATDQVRRLADANGKRAPIPLVPAA